MEKKVGNNLYVCCFTQYSNRESYELSDDSYGENKVAEISVYYNDDGTKKAILENVDLIETEKVKDICEFMLRLEKNE